MRLIFGFIVAVSLIGCASVGVTRTKPAPAKPTNCKLDIFASESDVKKPFEVVCLLDAKTSTGLFDDRTMAGATKEAMPAACKCGADAIVVMGGHAGETSFWGNGQGYSIVKAVRYTEK